MTPPRRRRRSARRHPRAAGLDLRTGRVHDLPLPTDGIDTTFWPYQLAVTGRLVVGVTDIGAVAVRRPG